MHSSVSIKMNRGRKVGNFRVLTKEFGLDGLSSFTLRNHTEKSSRPKVLVRLNNQDVLCKQSL